MRDNLILVFLVLYVSLDYVQPQDVRQDHPFDLLIFTQEWPQTVCKEWKMKSPSHTCTFASDPDSWTIHGVWPTKLHTMGPAFCNRSWHFDPEAVKPIEAPLKEYWTNIEDEPKPYGLWTHEWTKHGTCAAVLEPLNSEYKYFANGLNWIQKYSMTEILNSYNIIPSNDKEYPLAEIHKAVTDTLHVNPAIECRKIEGKSWLVEIRICFNKTLHLSDCDGIVGFKHKQAPGLRGYTEVLTNCDVAEDILYTKSLEEPPKRETYKNFNGHYDLKDFDKQILRQNNNIHLSGHHHKLRNSYSNDNPHKHFYNKLPVAVVSTPNNINKLKNLLDI